MRRRESKTKYLLILLLLIAVGYAAIATTLKINGSADVKSARWDVYWENPQVLSGSVTNTAPTLSESDTKATFDVTLNEPGDYYEFTIDAVNNGSLDAKIDTDGIVKQVKNSSGEVVNPTILKYEVTNNDQEHTAIQEGHILAKKSGNTPTKETYRVRVEYRNDSGINPEDLDDNDLVFTIEFSVKYVQGPKGATPSPQPSGAISYVTRQTEGQITPGDVVKIGDSENFYVLSSDSNTTTLLAKYNLLVGNETDDWGNTFTPMTAANTPGYGLQSDTAFGWRDATIEYKGMVAFSATNYWDDGDGNLVSPYNANGASYDGNPYPSIYNKTIKTAPDFTNDGFGTSGYSIAYYVEEYVDKLVEMGAPSTIEGRILTYEEADAKKNIQDSGASIILGNNQSYWIGSADYELYPFTVDGGDFNNSISYDNADSYGVRPVIEIPTSALQ